MCTCVHIPYCNPWCVCLFVFLLVGSRTLFKFIKKFEAALSEPCQSALVETAQEEQLISLQKQETSENQETKIQHLNNILRKKLTAKTDTAQVTRNSYHLPSSGLLAFWVSGSLSRCRNTLLCNRDLHDGNMFVKMERTGLEPRVLNAAQLQHEIEQSGSPCLGLI